MVRICPECGHDVDAHGEGNRGLCFTLIDQDEYCDCAIIYPPHSIHDWFELTYASYLVLPRSVLQSAPEKWQREFVSLLRELHDRFGDTMPDHSSYSVKLKDSRTGKFLPDPLADYDRGRRYISSKRTRP